MAHKNRVRNQGLYGFHYIMKPHTAIYWECLHFKIENLQETVFFFLKRKERKNFFSDKISDVRNEPERSLWELTPFLKGFTRKQMVKNLPLM